MTEHSRGRGRSEKNSADNAGTGGQKAPEMSGEPCRCKEIALKTPSELLKLALKDLAFWKKKK